MPDSLNIGRKIGAFNVNDDYNRVCLGIEVDHSLPVQRVIQSLEHLIERLRSSDVATDQSTSLMCSENGHKF
jgi:hypothetical protein